MPTRSPAIINRSWYRRLIKWIKKFIGIKPEQEQDPRIIKEWRSSLGILCLVRRSTPESIRHGAYQFTAHDRTQRIHLLTCDRYVRIGFGGRIGGGSGSVEGDRRSGRSGYYAPQKSKIKEGIRNGKAVRSHPQPTHRLSLALIETHANFTTVRMVLRWSYAVDFIGINGIIADRNDFARMITAELAQMMLYKDAESINWEEAIDEIARRMVGANHEILKNDAPENN